MHLNFCYLQFNLLYTVCHSFSLIQIIAVSRHVPDDYTLMMGPIYHWANNIKHAHPPVTPQNTNTGNVSSTRGIRPQISIENLSGT